MAFLDYRRLTWIDHGRIQLARDYLDLSDPGACFDLPNHLVQPIWICGIAPVPIRDVELLTTRVRPFNLQPFQSVSTHDAIRTHHGIDHDVPVFEQLWKQGLV